MDPLTLSLLIGGGVSLAKGIFGGAQKRRGQKEVESAVADIKYSRPEEYEQIMNILGQRVSGVGSRREAAEQHIRSQTAGSISGISQLADSPTAALTAFSGIKARETQAIADLGIQYEGIKDEATMGVARGLEMGAGYSEKEQYYNEMYKEMIKANMGASRMGAGMNMMWGGMEGMGAAGLDYAGTKYLSSIYAGNRALENQG